MQRYFITLLLRILYVRYLLRYFIMYYYNKANHVCTFFGAFLLESKLLVL